MDDRDTLMAIAQIAATFVGFASVVFAVSRSAAGGMSVAERTALSNLLVPASCVLFLAFVPVIAFAGFSAQPMIWRVSNGVLGVVHLTLVISATRAATRSQMLEPLPLRFVLIPGGFVAMLANFIVLFGFLQHFAAMIYVGGLVWFLLVSAIQFVMLINLHARTS